MQLKNIVNIEYSKVLPDGTTTILQEQSNAVLTQLMPKNKPQFKNLYTYNYSFENTPTTSNDFLSNLLLPVLIYRLFYRT